MERIIHVRLQDEEIGYIDNYYNGSGSNFVHDAIKKELKTIKKNKKQMTLQKYSQSFIMLGLGAIFILFSASTKSLIAFLLIFLLGVFFMINGLSTIGWKVFKRRKKIS